MNEQFRQWALAGSEAQRRLAVERAEAYRWFMEPLARRGWSLEAIRQALEAYRIKTPSGRGKWSKAMVRRALIRLDLHEQRRAA